MCIIYISGLEGLEDEELLLLAYMVMVMTPVILSMDGSFFPDYIPAYLR